MVPPKSIHFPLRKKREENRQGGGELGGGLGGRGGGGVRVRWKVKAGWGVRVCERADEHGEYITLFQSSTVWRDKVQRDTRLLGGDAPVATS